MAKRARCTATTKKGTRCTRRQMDGQKTCLAHAPKKTRDSKGFGGAQPRAGRPPVPRATDLQRDLVERHACAILRPHFKALGLLLHDDGTITQLEQGAVITGASKDGDVIASAIEDLGAQIAAAEKLLDRVFGRPKQTQELTGAGGQALIPPVIPHDSDWDRDVKHALADLAPATNGNGNGHSNGNGHR